MKLKATIFGACLSVCSVFSTGQVMAQSMTVQDMNARLDNLYGTHDPYHIFFDTFKENIAKKDKVAVAAVVKYPLFVQLKEKQVRIKTAKQFIQNYDAIMTPKIEKIVKEQQFESMLATYRGMAFGNGEIWFSGFCLDKTCKDPKKLIIRIIGINN